MAPGLTFTKIIPDKIGIWKSMAYLTELGYIQNESRIVRANALQGLYDSFPNHKESIGDFKLLLSGLAAENIPSLTARIRKIGKLLKSQK